MFNVTYTSSYEYFSRSYLLDPYIRCYLWNNLHENLRTEDLNLSFVRKRCRGFYKKYSLQASSPERSGSWAVKEEELATTSLEFEYLHRKSRCEMLIGGYDITKDVITPGTCFSTSVYIRAYWRKSDRSVDREPQGNWRWNSNSRDVVASSPSFCLPAVRAPQRACSQATKK